MLKQLFRVLRKKPGQRMPIMTIGKIKIKTKETLSSRRQRNLARRLQVWSFWDEIVQESQSTVSSFAAETELSLNLTEPCTPRSADPVEWWKHNAIRPPNLAAIAMSFLGAPPSSVPSERRSALLRISTETIAADFSPRVQTGWCFSLFILK